LSRDRLLSAVADASSERRCADDCSCARSLPAATAALLSTSAAKLSFPGNWSGRAGFGGGATGMGALAAASDVKLYTGGLSQ